MRPGSPTSARTAGTAPPPEQVTAGHRARMGVLGDMGYPEVQAAFRAATLFFAVSPLISILVDRPEPGELALLLLGWAVFGVALVALFRPTPVVSLGGPWLPLATVAITLISATVVIVFHTYTGSALFFYAGVIGARLMPERRAMAAILGVSLATSVSIAIGIGPASAGIALAVTVGTISLTMFSLWALGRVNRDLQAARSELADLAVSEERARIARDLHDMLGHSLSMIALKSELARRTIHDDPDRATAEIGDVERTAREMLSAVRETVSGYRSSSLAMELAGARAALAAAGIDGHVEPAPDGLPAEVDSLLGWAVREGTTNVLRHSGATTATIRILTGKGRTGVEVVDDGGGRGTQPPGSGLTGLRERAMHVGGSVEAGPLPERGFRLRVLVPQEYAT